MAGRPSKTRTQHCNRQDALSRLRQAESFVEVADMVITGTDNDVATPGVAAALAVLAGITASDAACCAKLKMRARGQDHKEAVPMLGTVHPRGPYGTQQAYQIGMLAAMETEQIAVRLPRRDLEALDDLVKRGVYPSRAAAVRAGVAAITALERRRAVDDAITEGYRRVPPTPEEDAAALASLREAIAEEPW